jgi:methionyl-tRNA formyltransferase
MRVLLLSPCPERIVSAFAQSNDECLCFNDKIDLSFLRTNNIEFIVSYNYPHIIRKDILEEFPLKIINLHISYLPYNRGKDPNFWSFFENTPKGVSIHVIDEGLDTGNILSQRLVELSATETLASSYLKLQDSISSLFVEIWPDIRLCRNAGTPQTGRGSFHRGADKMPYMAQFPLGWDTPVADVEALGRSVRKSQGLD